MSRFEKLINKNTSVCEEQLITTEEYIHKYDAGCILFDRILDRGEFPEQWTQSVLYPLQKDNYSTKNPTFLIIDNCNHKLHYKKFQLIN